MSFFIFLIFIMILQCKHIYFIWYCMISSNISEIISIFFHLFWVFLMVSIKFKFFGLICLLILFQQQLYHLILESLHYIIPKFFCSKSSNTSQNNTSTLLYGFLKIIFNRVTNIIQNFIVFGEGSKIGKSNIFLTFG